MASHDSTNNAYHEGSPPSAPLPTVIPPSSLDHGIRIGEPPLAASSAPPASDAPAGRTITATVGVGLLTITLYMIACASPVFRFAPNPFLGDSVSGLRVLEIGWLAVFGGIVAWYANVLFIPALILFWRGHMRVARWLALTALCIASTSLFVRNYPYPGPHGGGERPIASFGIGFYAWLSSFLVLTIAAFSKASSANGHAEKSNPFKYSRLRLFVNAVSDSRVSVKLILAGTAATVAFGIGWWWHRPADVREMLQFSAPKQPLPAEPIVKKHRPHRGSKYSLPGFNENIYVEVEDIEGDETATVKLVGPGRAVLAIKKDAKPGDRMTFAHAGKEHQVKIVRDVNPRFSNWLKAELVAPPDAVDNHHSTFLIASTRTGDAEIFLVNPFGGGDARNLTRHRGEESFPAWSHDKTKIAFISDRDGRPNVFVMDADGANVKQLTHEAGEKDFCSCPTWSPDGKKIAYCRYQDSTYACTVVMDADGGNAKSIRRNAWDPAWSPDGKKIAFASSIDGIFKVCVMDLDGANMSVLPGSNNNQGHVYPAWSPDGTKIAYTDLDGGSLEIHVCDADGANVKKLTAQGGFNAAAVWSPDGKSIAFQHRVGGASAIYLIDADGSNAREILSLRDDRGLMRGNRPAWRSN